MHPTVAMALVVLAVFTTQQIEMVFPAQPLAAVFITALLAVVVVVSISEERMVGLVAVAVVVLVAQPLVAAQAVREMTAA